MGTTNSSLRAQFAQRPNLLFQWIDEYYRGGDLDKASRLLHLEPEKCLALRYSKANEPDALTDEKRYKALSKYVYRRAEQSTALHWVCTSSFIHKQERAMRRKLGLAILELSPLAHHAVDADGFTPFGVLMRVRLSACYDAEFIEGQLQLLHRMLDLGLSEYDHKAIVRHLQRIGYYWSRADITRLHQRLWKLALEVAFPPNTDMHFRRALLLMATGGRSPEDTQGESSDAGMLKALAIPGAVQPDLVWGSFSHHDHVGKDGVLIPNAVPLLTLCVQLQHIRSARAMLKQYPEACESQLTGAAVVSPDATSIFHLATGNARVFKSVEVTNKSSGSKTTAILSDEREHFTKLAEPLCLELLAETKRLFPQTWRETCWMVPDSNHRTAIDNARDMQMALLLRQMEY